MIGRTLGLMLVLSLATDARAGAIEMARSSGINGGLVVHVGCDDGKLTASLRANDRFVVQGLDIEAANVAKARAHVRSLGAEGKVTAATFDGERLPYTDNLVNLLVVSKAYRVSAREMLRVPAPGGAALAGEGSRRANGRRDQARLAGRLGRHGGGEGQAAAQHGSGRGVVFAGESAREIDADRRLPSFTIQRFTIRQSSNAPATVVGRHGSWRSTRKQTS